MKTTQQQDMDFIKLTEYIHYALTPVTNNKGIILFTTVVIGILALPKISPFNLLASGRLITLLIEVLFPFG